MSLRCSQFYIHISFHVTCYNSQTVNKYIIMRLHKIVILIFIIQGHKCDLSVNVKSNYSDTCEYVNSIVGQYPCGDICLENSGICTCGGEVMKNDNAYGGVHPRYCCTPSLVQCRKTILGAFCPEGEVLEAEEIYMVDVDKFDPTGTIPCNGRCYNDYFSSHFIGTASHYTCPDECISWSAMCRGVSFCEGDEEMCGEDLRCPIEIKKHSMSTDPVRSYCFGIDPSI